MPTITNNASINLSLNYPDSYVLIIGGAGYIGSNTNALLNSLGVRTIVYDSLVYGHKEALDFTPLQSLSLESKPSSYGGGGLHYPHNESSINLYEFLHKANLAHPVDFCTDDIDLGFESRLNIYINPSSYTTFIQADLSAKDTIRTIFNSFHIYAVLHFAAFAYVGESVQDPCKYYRNNIANTINLLEVMQECGCKNIIFSSTCSTYGNPLHLPIMESHPQNPINPYGYSKLVVEQILRDFSLAYNFRYVILRYFNAAGASMLFNIGESHNPETHVIPLVIQTALQKRDFFSVFGNDYPTRDGSCIRDYIHVDDLASAHVLALKYLQNGGDSNIFNLGNGDGFSVFEILDCVERITNNQIPHKIEQRREGDPAILIGDSTRAREILHWNPQFFKLEHIIQSAFKWHSNARY